VINVAVFGLNLSVSLHDVFVFCIRRIETGFTSGLEAKERAFGIAFARAGALHFILYFSTERRGNIETTGVAGAQLISDSVFNIIDRELGVQNRLYAKTFVIQIIRPVLPSIGIGSPQAASHSSNAWGEDKVGMTRIVETVSVSETKFA
jgi:hypothetical protein